MSQQSDLILFGPRLAIALGREATARIFSGLRRVAMPGSGNGASGESALMGARPAAEDDPPESKSDALGAGPDLPEVVSDVPQAVDGGFPEPSGNDPGDISSDPSPHHALNAPVGAPDPTEWPDPYDQRSDPRDPPRSDGEPFAEEPHPPVGSTSTSDPHPDADIEAPGTDPPEHDKLDD
jgi:hypothetical protein